MSGMLSVTNLIKHYGRVAALSGLSCTFEPGRIYGLLGPNASGKTTFLKICAARIMRYRGDVLLDGVKPGPATKAKVAYLPEGRAFLGWMKVGDAINYSGEFFHDFDRERAARLADELELKKAAPIDQLSKGMKARLKLAVVLSRRARLYLLDEAFDGVDPVTREKLIDIILDTFAPDSTMVLATHHIDYVEELLHAVKLIYQGRIVGESTADELRQHTGRSVADYYLETFRNVQAT